MMYGRGYSGSGYNGSGFSENARCFGYGFMNNGWGLLIIAGVIIAIVLLVYIFLHNRNKNVSKNTLFEVLKMKYVQGEISEEEYLKRKEVLGRK